jgi:hypothetical protein
MANGVARLWFDGHTLPAELDPATMLMVKGNTPCLVIGRVVARVDVFERDFS